MELKNVIFEKEGYLVIVIINRLKVLNVLNLEILKDLDIVIEDLEKDSNIYFVILIGVGEKFFVVGVDILEMKDFNE